MVNLISKREVISESYYFVVIMDRFLNCGGNWLLSNSEKNKKVLLINKVEADKLFQIYMRVQSGDKTALNELFKTTDSKQISKADEINKEYRMSHMDDVLDSELVLDNEKIKQGEDWIESVNINVTFQFSCLNKLLYKKKKSFLLNTKKTGYENGQKIKNNNCSKFYKGEYDISDFNELMYETIIEIFNEKTDENNCLTLDGKKNEKYPICDGVSLLRNISYFTSRKINKRAKNSYLDIFDTESWSEEADEEDTWVKNSRFDEYVVKSFLNQKADRHGLQYIRNIWNGCRNMMYINSLRQMPVISKQLSKQ